MRNSTQSSLRSNTWLAITLWSEGFCEFPVFQVFYQDLGCRISSISTIFNLFSIQAWWMMLITNIFGFISINFLCFLLTLLVLWCSSLISCTLFYWLTFFITFFPSNGLEVLYHILFWTCVHDLTNLKSISLSYAEEYKKFRFLTFITTTKHLQVHIHTITHSICIHSRYLSCISPIPSLSFNTVVKWNEE